MLGARKVKVAVKTTERKERIETMQERVMGWVEDNYPRAIAVGVLILLIPLIAWGVNSHREAKNRRASAAYAKITKEWTEDLDGKSVQYEKLLPELEKSLKEYDGTPSALNAQLDLALIHLYQKRFEDAVTGAGRVLNEIPAGSGLRPLARYQLALTYVAIGKKDEALRLWTDLKNDGLKGAEREIEWQIARIYEAKGDYSKAEQQYELALKAPGGYPSTALLQAEKASAKAKVKAGS
ncbi:MAG: YfgM family protein [Syntrophobacteraceae bacterium]